MPAEFVREKSESGDRVRAYCKVTWRFAGEKFSFGFSLIGVAASVLR
jgi:hypothetical protein